VVNQIEGASLGENPFQLMVFADVATRIIVAIAIVEIAGDHFVPSAPKLDAEIGADETTASRDQYFHGSHLIIFFKSIVPRTLAEKPSNFNLF
jgi:hypothetical protein